MGGPTYVAVDLGAESGRVVAGTLDDGRITVQELHRFPNVQVRTPDGLHWDVLRLYAEVLTGLRIAAQRYGRTLCGIGVDSWAVDYALLDAGGRLLGNPYHYRDARTDGASDEAAQRVPRAEQYARTGIFQLPVNTIYQLMAQVRGNDRSLELANTLVMIPDLFHYWLSGEAVTEYTNATTSGALDAAGHWARDMLDRLGVPHHMLRDPTPPATRAGTVQPSVCRECDLDPVPIILPATHDTACAVLAIPVEPQYADRYAFISCGTWSLLGMELEQPILTEEARLAGFTNEGGICGSFRFLTNISGLWLLQECRRSWARHGTIWDYEYLNTQAAAAQSPNVVIEVDDPAFLRPPDMPAAIDEHLRRTGQQPVEDPPTLARAILEGLALKHRVQLERAERLTGRRAEVIHMVGGGVRSRLLCQLTADACGRPVVAGPAEGTAVGNLLAQAMGDGEIRDRAQARDIARASAEVTLYQPADTDRWDETHARWRRLHSP
jgi:rhamnulokinase